MFFRKKVDRVIDVEKAEERFEKEMEGQQLEKHDRLAMIIAGLIIFIPVLLGVIAIFLLVIWFFFYRFL